MTKCEEEGMNFVGGFLCYKLGKKYKWMGQKTKIAENNSEWMQLKSRGDLFMPSQKLQEFLVTAESVFRKYHKEKLSLECNPITRLAAILEQRFPDYTPDLIALYSRTRFFLRLKSLNYNIQIQEKNIQRRHANHVNKYK